MENAIYVALAISGVINAVLLYVVFQQSQGLAASIPPQAFPVMLDFIKWVVKQTPTDADDKAIGVLFPQPETAQEAPVSDTKAEKLPDWAEIRR